MRKIVLHGHLKKRFGATFELEVATPGEAIRLLGVNLPGFIDALRIGSYEVVYGARNSGDRLTLDLINDFKMGKGDLHLIPSVRGAKSGGGTLKAILGVALVGAAVFFSGGTLAAPLMSTGLLSGVTWGNVALIGAGLAFAGASMMLSPNQKAEQGTDESFTLQGPGNTYAQGQAIPLIYGEVITGSVLASGGLDVERI